MGYLWDIFGISLGYLWDIFGISLGYHWDIFVISLGYLWDIFGISLGYIWDIFGISLGHLWDIFGISLGYLLSERTSGVSPVIFADEGKGGRGGKGGVAEPWCMLPHLVISCIALHRNAGSCVVGTYQRLPGGYCH